MEPRWGTRIRSARTELNTAGEALMRDVAEAFSVSDLRPLFDAVDENVVWRSASPATGSLPFGGVYRGRKGVRLLTAEMAHAYSTMSLKPRKIASDGAIVWGLFDVSGERLLACGESRFTRPFFDVCAFRWRLCGRRIAEHWGFLGIHGPIWRLH